MNSTVLDRLFFYLLFHTLTRITVQINVAEYIGTPGFREGELLEALWCKLSMEMAILYSNVDQEFK
jgi:hypothetical protein